MKKKYIYIAGMIIVILVLVVNKKNLFVKQVSTKSTIGIIDGSISSPFKEHIIFGSFSDNNNNNNENNESHGENMIDFAQNFNKKIEIYYFDATNNDGKISTEAIIEGLDWFKENDASNYTQ